MPNILIINPISSQKYLAEKFKSYNFFSIALYTKKYEEFTDYFLPDPNYFDKQIFINGDCSVNEIVKQLPQIEFDFILNGTDEFLSITEKIIAILKPELNNLIELNYTRINKFSMQERFRTVGLPYIKQAKINIVNMPQINFTKYDYPCFIKPVDGGGSIGIEKCNSVEELVTALNNSKKLVSVLNRPFNEYIIQEVIVGQEIFVDTFSIAGNHYISSIQTIYKEDFADSVACYRYETLVYDHNLWEQAGDIVKRALNACGFRNGFNHTELFLLKDNSFKIIEINPRISGGNGMLNRLAESQNLFTQIDLLAMHLNNKKLKDSSLNNVTNYAKLLYLYNFTDKPTQNISQQLKNLKLASKVETIMCSKINSIQDRKKTVGNLDAFVLLSYPNKDIVNADHNKIIELESSGKLFSI